MVVKLVGNVEGQNVIFTRDKGDIWIAEVPAQHSGRYVIELTAYDEAGNMAYRTDVLFTYDPLAMKITIEPLPYRCILLGGNYDLEVIKRGDACD